MLSPRNLTWFTRPLSRDRVGSGDEINSEYGGGSWSYLVVHRQNVFVGCPACKKIRVWELMTFSRS